MNKNSACALFVGLVTLFSCSDEKLFNTNTLDVKGKMTMNAKVVNSDGASTRASFDDVAASTWVFNFQTNDVVKVNNTENSTYCPFTKTEETFVSSDAMPTTATSTWYAYFPSENINLSNQAGTPESIANLYALAGSQADVPGGTQSLSIELAAKSSILKIDNQVGEINIRVKDADGKFISGLKANNGEYTVISGTTSTTLLSATEVGTYYVIVPSAQKIDIYNGDVKIKGTKEAGLTAGKCYSISINKGPDNNGYAYVDLGILDDDNTPIYWATMNVGASKVTEYGNFYAWGETTGYNEAPSAYPSSWSGKKNSTYMGQSKKTIYDWTRYKWGKGKYDLYKYCYEKNYGIVDYKLKLDIDDDAARSNWGGSWRLPTKSEFEKLIQNCYWVWTSSYNGVYISGYIVYKQKNIADKGTVHGSTEKYTLSDTHIFIPASGTRGNTLLSRVDTEGYYWTSECEKWTSCQGCFLYFSTSEATIHGIDKCYGRTLRAVCQ